MKKLVVLMMVLFAVTAQANMLNNPGFETAINSDTDWWSWGSYHTSTSADVHGGAMAMRLAGFSGTWTTSSTGETSMGTPFTNTWVTSGTSWAQVGQWVDVAGNTAYTFDVWAKDEGSASNLYFELRWEDASSVSLGTDYLYFGAVDTAWENAALGTYTAPAGAAYANVILMGNPGASILVDDVTMVPEPMTIGLLGLGGLFLRRRKA